MVGLSHGAMAGGAMAFLLISLEAERSYHLGRNWENLTKMSNEIACRDGSYRKVFSVIPQKGRRLRSWFALKRILILVP